MSERVQKIIASSGLCARRKAEELIEQGRVQVNGVTITLGDKADSENDIILVDGAEIQPSEKVYFLLHKPKDYITTTNDPYAKKKVIDLVPNKTRVFPIGRLDKDATGLLILTNDGDFANKVAHPTHGVVKTYIAVLKEPIRPGQVKKLTTGVIIDGKTIKSKAIQLEKNTVAITVHIGVHKIVKRLFKAVGSYVKHLHRTHIGSLALDIEQGECRELTEEDKKLIFRPPQLSKDTFV